MIQVSVILPTRNEAQNIAPFLSSLPADLSLIVVDASEDNTPALIAELRPQHTQIIRSAARIAEARQIGAAAAETNWLLFTDVDIAFAPDYFTRLATCDDRCGVIYGVKQSLDDFAGYYRWFRRGQWLLHRLGIPAATGSNLLIRRDALTACGGFDLHLPVNEDTEIVWRIQRQGFRICFVPDLIVYERDHRRLRRGVLRKTAHTLTRGLFLYLNILPARWRNADWGYWA